MTCVFAFWFLQLYYDATNLRWVLQVVPNTCGNQGFQYLWIFVLGIPDPKSEMSYASHSMTHVRSINTKSQYITTYLELIMQIGCEISYSGDKKRKRLRCVFLMAKCEIGRQVPVQMKLWSGTFLNIFIKWNIVGLVTNVHSWEYLLRSHTQLSPVWIATPDNTPSIFRFWVGVGRLLPWSLS